MKLLPAGLVVALLLSLPVAARAQGPGPAQSPATSDPASIPARVELHPFPSRTLPDSAFLKGEEAGQPVTLAAELRLSQASGKQPVVVLMHGSGGVGANIGPWVEQFNAMGMATLVIDGFTGRGLTSVSSDQAKLGRLNFILDIYRALDILAKHPRIDTSRIALMGFSRGGQAALYASLDRFQKMWNRSGVTFAAYVPFYPDCAISFMGETDVAGVPIRIFHGAADDYDPVSVCQPYVARLKAAGRDVVVKEYAGAEHGFDTPFPIGRVEAPTSQTVRACTIRETEPGVLTNAATGQPFTYKDACVQLGPHVGGNAEGAAAAHKDVGAFLATQFKLKP